MANSTTEQFWKHKPFYLLDLRKNHAEREQQSQKMNLDVEYLDPPSTQKRN